MSSMPIPMPGGQNPTMGMQPAAGGVGTAGGGVFKIGPGGTPIPGGPNSSGNASNTTAVAASNPFVPTAAPSGTPIPMSTASNTPGTSIGSNGVVGSGTPGLGVASTGLQGSSVSGDPNNNLGKAENNLYGSGLGGALTGLLGSIGGVDSASLQNYVASLQPQEATAQANTNAALGSAGVSGNSSVTGIADANLQSQETAAIAGESAQLQQSGQQLEASILTGQEQAQAQATADSSPWAIFGDVVGGLGALGKGITGI